MRLKEFLNKEANLDDNIPAEPLANARSSNNTRPDGAYDDHKAKVAELLEEIDELVEQHEHNQAASSDKWSHASEMAEVVAKLQEVVDMLQPDGGDDGEVDHVTEAKNHLGEPTQETYLGWKRACKAKHPKVWFDGDKDIAQAMVGPNPYKRGETISVGEWDGASGSVYK